MMGEAEDWPVHAPEDIEVGSFRGERGCGRGQCGLAIEPSFPYACAGQEVSDGFQGGFESTLDSDLLVDQAFVILIQAG